MAIIVETKKAPKRYASKHELDSRMIDVPPAELFEWCKNSLSGTVHWNAIQFRDPSTARRWAFHRQRHFEDGYLIYTFWLSDQKDIMLFKLRWSLLSSI